MIDGKRKTHIVTWLLNSRIRMFVKSAVKKYALFLNGKKERTKESAPKCSFFFFFFFS